MEPYPIRRVKRHHPTLTLLRLLGKRMQHTDVDGTGTTYMKPKLFPASNVIQDCHSLNIVKSMEIYNPDSTWQPTEDEWPSSVADASGAVPAMP